MDLTIVFILKVSHISLRNHKMISFSLICSFVQILIARFIYKYLSLSIISFIISPYFSHFNAILIKYHQIIINKKKNKKCLIF